ncbi:glycoside hydrolase family 2 TIM barrel-domain containing protein [Massilia horti]|nr:glycoside hydrolase family 2 TIM barrel-domain containing protein [Massilia horti]
MTTGAATPDPLAIADDGWTLWLDRAAKWQDDVIYLPENVPPMSSLPVNPPTGGWDALYKSQGLAVTLPTTVEEHFWGQFGERSYTADEYRYAEDDPVPQNGAVPGVSWWVKKIDIPASANGQQVWLHIRGARMRAEVFLNEVLVGYSIMSELPIDCDLTAAMKPGQPNRLAIRITNPGGRYDWKDSNNTPWGKVKLYHSHGFGGIDRGLHLSMHPMEGRICDAWVLNTPDPRVVMAHAEISTKRVVNAADLSAKVLDKSGAAVPAEVKVEQVSTADGMTTARLRVHVPSAKLWDLDTPNLYRLRLQWKADKAVDTRIVRFGFRWFAAEGIGKNALFRLNGRRIKLYTAISWGFWGYNGLFPTPELARREVLAAKALGLNSLAFHRNVGKPEVLDIQDEMGLTRTMEPGAGRMALGKMLKPGESLSPADAFSRDFMVSKCKAMVRAMRSHPSLVHYTLQNEVSADLNNPDVESVLRAMHDLDPSRSVILNDGFVGRGAAQAMFLPYDDHFYRSDVEKAGGWWVNHQGAGDQWYDKFYVDKDNFIHRQTMTEAIVEFGEMQGCAVGDNHVKMIADIQRRGGKSYDLEDHKAIVGGAAAFLDKWGFRKAFPTTESYFLAVGKKQYDAWQNYLENIRICDQVDMAAISGWESTSIENHSGIVDNLRYFHADPNLIRVSLLPVRPVAKQRRYTYATGEMADLDIWLLNDTGKSVSGKLTLSVIDPDGKSTKISDYAVPANVADQFSYVLAEHVKTPAFSKQGKHTIRLELSGRPEVTFTRDLWVTRTDLKPAAKPTRIAVSGIAKSLRERLAALPGVEIEDFQPGRPYDGLIASGLKADEISRRQIGDETGLEAAPKKGEKPKLVLGELPSEVLTAVKGGLPLLAMVPEDGLADGVAKQLTDLGLFNYAGPVGNLRAPWMGNWNILRAHSLFDGIPTDIAAGVWHQIQGQPSNGLIVDGDGIEVIAAYSRDHDRHMGAASFTAQKAGMKLLFHRLPDMAAPLQTRFLLNAIRWLTA